MHAVVLRCDEAAHGALMDAGLVVAAVAEAELVRLGANGKGQQLVACRHISEWSPMQPPLPTQADAKKGLVGGVLQKHAQMVDGRRAHLRRVGGAAQFTRGLTAGSPGPLLMKSASKSSSLLKS